MTPVSRLNRPYAANGLNQYTAAGTANFTYDTKGNLTADGTNSFCYSSENLLTGENGTCAAPTVALSYDPFLRLYQVAGTTTTHFAYDGLNLIADYNGANALQHRYVFGPGMDEPIVEYSSTGSRTWLSSDERGSIVARSSSTGALGTANTYDDYGIPGSGNAGLFQYTGQAWIAQLGMYYYKARIYSPTLGRFLQTDPIGTADNANLYAYVHDDPVNLSDPLGLEPPIVVTGQRPIVITGHRRKETCPGSDGSASCSGGPTGGTSTGGVRGGPGGEIVVTAHRGVIVVIGHLPSPGPGHAFVVNSNVCGRALTPSEAKALLSRFAVPGHAGEALTNGQFFASDGWRIGGEVATAFSRGGLRVTNVTIPGEHIFAGQVQRDIIILNGQTAIVTFGQGNAQMDGFDAIGALRDGIDQIAGPGVFDRLDAAAAAFAKSHFEGC